MEKQLKSYLTTIQVEAVQRIYIDTDNSKCSFKIIEEKKPKILNIEPMETTNTTAREITPKEPDLIKLGINKEKNIPDIKVSGLTLFEDSRKNQFLTDTLIMGLVINLQNLIHKNYNITEKHLSLDELIKSAGFNQNEFNEYIESAFLAQKGNALFQQGAIFFDLAKRLNLSYLFEPPKTLKVEPPLFAYNNLEATPSCAIVESTYAVFVGKRLSFSKSLLNSSELVIKNEYKTGTVELIFKSVSDTIVEKFGETTFAIFLTLLTYLYRNKKSTEVFIVVPFDDLLMYLDKHYAKDKFGNRLTKQQRYEFLANHLYLIKDIDVFISKWIKDPKKNPDKENNSFAVKQTPLINIEWIGYSSDEELERIPDWSKVKDAHIKYKAGAWFEQFCDEGGINLNQFGYINKDVLALKSRNDLGKRLGLLLPIKLQQNKKGEFKIVTLLEQLGEHETLESIATEKDSLKKGVAQTNFKRNWDFGVNELLSLPEPYQIEYKNPPSWIINENERKPKGWFDIWLNLVIIIKNPACLNGNSTKSTSKTQNSPKSFTPSVEDILKALEENPKVSIRKLMTWYGKAPNWFTRNKNKLKDFEIKDLLNGIKILAKRL